MTPAHLLAVVESVDSAVLFLSVPTSQLTAHTARWRSIPAPAHGSVIDAGGRGN
jgi:hypothetical protein